MRSFPPFSSGMFPQVRLRRTREEAWCRTLTAETSLAPHNLILPVFVRCPSQQAIIASMPGIKRHTLDELPLLCKKVVDLNITAIALFPVIPAHQRSFDGKEILNPNGLIPQSIRIIRQTAPTLGIITDVALDGFTTHGHDGLVKDGKILNDQTLGILEKAAVLHAQAGAHAIAPSDMMDGRIGCIRRALDAHGFHHTVLISYAAKYASHFYAPFRDALGSQAFLQKSSKKSYQLNPSNSQEALREGHLDMQEGADMLMIKPALLYLDIVYRFHQAFPLPLLVYHVSGEYAMLKATGTKRWGLCYLSCLIESLTACRRAGAQGIITYGALDAARYLKKHPHNH